MIPDKASLLCHSADRTADFFRAIAAKFILSDCKAVERRELNLPFASREQKVRRKVAWLISFGVLALTPDPLFACGQLSHALQRRAQTAFERDLATTREVRGSYKKDTVTEAGERELERGGIYSRKGKLRYKVWNPAGTIMCGLYAYPSDGDKGIFYLRRIGKGEFNVVHYETD